eukprot:TRINITY_DN13117_c0_g4_i1.p1 TRINITY_DN13117_c0_g4~~TRINITY_DN13117_c0_g4_i1.p1  ORF type:complete len:248 (+),score=36.80 TRINITY_DN13117_c0_g4_i1:113-856(+)
MFSSGFLLGQCCAEGCDATQIENATASNSGAEGTETDKPLAQLIPQIRVFSGEDATSGVSKPSFIFQAHLVIEEKGVSGLNFDFLDEEVCIISNVFRGSSATPASTWNANCPPNLMLRRMDRILQVNGIAGSGERLIYELENATGAVNLSVKRPKDSEIQVTTGGKHFGLKLKISNAYPGMLVQSVTQDSVIDDFNSRNRELAVTKGDRIMAVHGSIDSQDMKQRLKEANNLEAGKHIILHMLSWTK